MKVLLLVVLTLVTTVPTFAESHLEKTDIQTNEAAVVDDVTIAALKRFFANPEKFINEEKKEFLEDLEATNPSKAQEVREIFDKYEEKLKVLNDSLKKSSSNKSLDEILKDSQLRKEISQLEMDLNRILAPNKSFGEIIEELKKTANKKVSKPQWYELIDKLFDRKTAQDIKKLVDDASKSETDFQELRASVKGKPASEIPKDVISKLSSKSKEVDAFRQKLADILQHIEKELTEKGLIKDVKVAGENTEARINQEKGNIINIINHNTGEAEKIKNKINDIFK